MSFVCVCGGGGGGGLGEVPGKYPTHKHTKEAGFSIHELGAGNMMCVHAYVHALLAHV